jgi:hypothetical protein
MVVGRWHIDIFIMETCKECGKQIISSVVKCFKRLHGKPERVCVQCFDKDRLTKDKKKDK